MRKFSLKSQAAYLSVSQFIGLAITTIIPILLVRMLTDRDFGIYRELLFMGSVAITLMQISLPQSLYYFYPRETGKRRELMTQTITLLMMSAFIGVIIFVIVTVAMGFAPSEVSHNLIIVSSISFFFESVATIVELIFVLEAQPRRNLVLGIVNSLCRLLTTLGFYLIFRSVLGLVIGMIVLQAGRFSFLIGYLKKRYDLGVGIPDKALFRAQLNYTLPMVGSAVVGLIGTQIDKGVITALMKPEEFAVYSVCSLGVLYSITLVSLAMGNVCLPRLSEMGGKLDLTGVRALWHKMVLMNGLLLIPTVCFCMVYAEEIITVIYTKKYVVGANVFRINLLFLIMMMSEFGRVPQALGHTRSVFVSNLMRSISALGLSLLLIPRIGLAGGAISSIGAFWVSGAMQLAVTRKALNLTLGELLPWRRLLLILAICTAVATALWLLPHWHWSVLISLLLNWLIFCIAVVGAYIALKLVDVRTVKEIFSQM